MNHENVVWQENVVGLKLEIREQHFNKVLINKEKYKLKIYFTKSSLVKWTT